MRLKKLKLRNFLSYAKLDFDFANTADESPSIYIISGINKDSNSSDEEDNSNGSGKSTLVGESISFNLFGRNLRGSQKKIKLENAIKFGEGTMLNDAEYFIDNNTVLKIRREKERDGKNNLEVTVDGETKTKRLKRLSENDIREFMGIEPDVYYQAISFYKDNISLLAMNYSQRLDFFKKLVNLTIMDLYYQHCKKYKDTTEKKISSLKTKKRAQEDIIEAIEANSVKYQKLIQDSIDVIKKDIEKIESKPVQDDTDLTSKIEELKKNRNKIDTEINNLKNTSKNDSTKIKGYQQDIKKFSKLKNTECESCGQLVTGDYADLIINAKTELVLSLEENVKLRESEIEIKSKESLDLDKKEQKIKKDIEKIKSENTIRKVQLESLYKQLKNKEKELEDVVNSIGSDTDTNVYIEKIQKLERAIELLDRKYEINTFWLENLATKSPVRSAIIRKHVSILSDIFEYYLNKLFKNTIIGRMEIDDEGNIDIILKNGNFEVNYWNLSSGEKKRADISILFALYTYIITLIPNAPKFIVLDEVVDSLDNDGIINVCNTIGDLFNRYQIDIFIVSHIPIPIDILKKYAPIKEILVTKEDDNSIAEYV